jgi:hypothetical protein
MCFLALAAYVAVDAARSLLNRAAPDESPVGIAIASFLGVRVDSAIATPDTIEVWGGSTLLWGSYFERLKFPGQPLSEQHGKFVIEWVRQADGTWLIQRYFRVPVPTPPPTQSGRGG